MNNFHRYNDVNDKTVFDKRDISFGKELRYTVIGYTNYTSSDGTTSNTGEIIFDHKKRYALSRPIFKWRRLRAK